MPVRRSLTRTEHTSHVDPSIYAYPFPFPPFPLPPFPFPFSLPLDFPFPHFPPLVGDCVGLLVGLEVGLVVGDGVAGCGFRNPRISPPGKVVLWMLK
jgi:hypothetical protein